MEKFRTVIERRIRGLQVYCGAVVVLLVCFNAIIPHKGDFLTGFVIGVFIATEILAVILINRYDKALKEEDTLRRLCNRRHGRCCMFRNKE